MSQLPRESFLAVGYKGRIYWSSWVNEIDLGIWGSKDSGEEEREGKGDTLSCKLSFLRGECSEVVAYQ